MDPMPSTDIIAHDEEKHGEHALVLEAAKDHVYRQQEVTLKDAQSFRSLLKTGRGFQYIDFDPDGEGGEGSVIVKNISRKQVIIDPSADNIDQARYVIIDSPLSNDELKRRYPKTYKEACNQKMNDRYVFSGIKGRENENAGHHGSKEADRYKSKDMTFVEDCWIKDYSMEAIPDDETQIQLTEESAELMQGINPDISKWEDHPAHIDGHRDQKIILVATALQIEPEMVTEQDIENAKEDPEIALRLAIIDDHIEMHEMYMESLDEEEIGKRPKYPNHLRLIIKTGEVIHFDGAPPVDDGLVPLVEFVCYKDEGVAEGIIKHLIPLQKTINELDLKEFKGLKLNANSGWLKDEQSGVDEDTLTDEDGIVVTKQQGTEVSRLPPGQVSPQLEARIRRDYEAMNRIEGTGETVFGEAPKGDPSGVLMRRLQMQALGRIRLKSTMIASAIYRRDKLILSRIMKYWSTERKLRTEDANGKIRFIKFDPRMMRDFSYELILAPGSTSGMDAETIAQTYKEMFLAGLIDLRTYATLVNLPKKQELLSILNEKDEQAAQMQEMQAQNQELQKQMLMMKANLAPNTLTPEEVKMVEQLAIQEQQEQITSNPMAVG